MTITIERQKFKIVVREPRLITNGMIATHDAYIEMDASNMRSDFLNMFMHYQQMGLIRVKVATIKPTEVKHD